MQNTQPPVPPGWRAGLATSLLLTLTACSSVTPPDFHAVQALTAPRLAADASLPSSDVAATTVRLQSLLAAPLGPDEAIQIALLNNRGLRAALGELGIAEADLAQAGRLPNPGFTFKHARDGGDVFIERSFTVDLLALITLPQRRQLADQHREWVRLSLANQVLQLASDTRRAYFTAVAAAQHASYAEQVAASAQASAELAGKLRQAGNWSDQDAAREQLYEAEAAAGLLQARQASVAAREHLARLLGLSGAQTPFILADRLPALPAQRWVRDDVEDYALHHRLDLQAQEQATAALAASLGLSKVTRWVDVLDVGAVRDAQPGASEARGYTVSIEVPLFDSGDARVARAEAVYQQAVDRLAEGAVNARSQVRERYAGYQSAYALAEQYRDHIVPLRKRIADESLLRYNGMLISVFELLADARQQAASVNAYIDALAAYWIADSDLQDALGGKLPDATEPPKGP